MNSLTFVETRAIIVVLLAIGTVCSFAYWARRTGKSFWLVFYSVPAIVLLATAIIISPTIQILCTMFAIFWVLAYCVFFLVQPSDSSLMEKLLRFLSNDTKQGGGNGL